MHSVWRTSIRFTLVTTVLLGLGYPLFVTGIAAVIFPHQASGSLILNDGTGHRLRAAGAELHLGPLLSSPPIGRRQRLRRHLFRRLEPGPIQQSLVDRIQGSIDKLATENPGKPVPIDLVTTSGSGLDPDITPDAAYFQVPRVAKARSISEDRIRQLIAQHTASRQLGLLGEPRVNVLELNLDLDKLTK